MTLGQIRLNFLFLIINANILGMKNENQNLLNLF